MTSKTTSEITFREFVEAGKAAGNVLVNEIERDVLSKLCIEGFTNQEIYDMLMPRLWGLYLEVKGNCLDEAFSELAPVIEANPDLANHPALKRLQEQLKKSLENLEKQDKKL